MPNPRLKDWEDAIVSAIGALALAGITDPSGTRAVTPLDVAGILRYARPQALGVFVTTSEEPYDDLQIGGNDVQKDVRWESDVIVMAPIRDSAVDNLRVDILTVADAIRDGLINTQPLTTPYLCFPIEIERTRYQSFDAGFVAAIMRITSGMQFNG